MLLEPMLSRLSGARDVTETLNVGLRDFVALHGAEMGDLQLVGSDGEFVIVAARGLGRAFLEVFERVSVTSGSACGRAARDGLPTFIPNVMVDPEYEHYRAFAATVPFRSVLSCPLFTADGTLIGMVSALSSHPFRPTGLERRTAEAYCARLAADITRFVPLADLPAWADATSAALLEATPV